MLTSDRVLQEKKSAANPEFGLPVAAGFKVYRGSICGVCADGTIVQAGATGTPQAIVAIGGVARHGQDNTGAANTFGPAVGAGHVWLKKGAWAFPFDTEPTWADVKKPVYAVDDETVSLTETPTSGAARLQVGTLVGFDENGTPFVLVD